MDIQKSVVIAMSGLMFAGMAALAASTAPASAATASQLVTDDGGGGGGGGGGAGGTIFGPGPIQQNQDDDAGLVG